MNLHHEKIIKMMNIDESVLLCITSRIALRIVPSNVALVKFETIHLLCYEEKNPVVMK